MKRWAHNKIEMFIFSFITSSSIQKMKTDDSKCCGQNLLDAKDDEWSWIKICEITYTYYIQIHKNHIWYKTVLSLKKHRTLVQQYDFPWGSIFREQEACPYWWSPVETVSWHGPRLKAMHDALGIYMNVIKGMTNTLYINNAEASVTL